MGRAVSLGTAETHRGARQNPVLAATQQPADVRRPRSFSFKENSALERTAGALNLTFWVGMDAPSVRP